MAVVRHTEPSYKRYQFEQIGVESFLYSLTKGLGVCQPAFAGSPWTMAIPATGCQIFPLDKSHPDHYIVD
jgi:hypothetical protein